MTLGPRGSDDSVTDRRLVSIDDDDEMRWTRWVAGLIVVGALYLRLSGPTIDTDGVLTSLGIVDPFCGGTRGMSALLRGDLGIAWRWNPLAPGVAVFAVLLIARLAVGFASHRWVNVGGRRRSWLMFVGAVLAVVWVNQQLQADRLIT